MIREVLGGRPAVFAAIGVGIGIAAGNLTHNSPAVYFYALVISVCAIPFIRPRFTFKLALLFLSFVLLGALVITSDEATYRNSWLQQLTMTRPEKVVMVGSIQNASETKLEYLWTLYADTLVIAGGRPITTSSAVLLRLSKNAKGHLALPQEDSRIRVFCALQPFHGPTNPHEFASSLHEQTSTHTEAEAILHSRFDYEVLAPPPPNIIRSVNEWIENLHTSISNCLSESIRDEAARGFVIAVVLGDREEMDKETLGNFTTAGVSHILAVSGFNVAIVALVVAQLLRLFGVYWQRWRISITMVMVFLYCVVVGFQPSVVRALIMIELYQLALLIERKPDPLNIIASAVVIELIGRPADLFDVGFQLSYGAVLGLILIGPKIRWFFEPLRNVIDKAFWHWSVDAIALSISASLASYPIIAYHFYRVSYIGVIANLPLIPISALITAFGFLLIPITLISSWLGQVYGDATALLTLVLLWTTRVSAHVPFGAHSASAPNWLYLLFFLGALLYILRADGRRFMIGRLILCLTFFFVLQLIGVPFGDSLIAKQQGKLQLLFFDVGEGDCILIHTPNDKTYCVDFGSLSHSGTSQAERTLIPFLRAENISSLDAAIITHMHLDHCGGAPSTIENCEVSRVLTSGEREASLTARVLDSLTRVKHIPVRALSRGDRLILDSDIVLYVLHPDRVIQAQYAAGGQSINAGTLAFKLVYKNTSVLFLGDVERSEEEEMLETYGAFLHTNVVKVAHHGSLTSSSKEFVQMANPQYAVISVGENNRFGHPATAVLKRWYTCNAKVCRTDKEGAILLVSDGTQVEQESWR